MKKVILLWKVTIRIKWSQNHTPLIRTRDERLARNNENKAFTFVECLGNTFKPFESEILLKEEIKICLLIGQSSPVGTPVKKFILSEIMDTIKKEINPKKRPDLT